MVESKITATTTNIAVIGALAYYRLTKESRYRRFLSWIKKNNIGNVEKLHIEDVINLYDEIYEHIPKKVFLARWYPSAEHDGDEEYRKAESRIGAIKEVVQQLNLELTDLESVRSTSEMLCITTSENVIFLLQIFRVLDTTL